MRNDAALIQLKALTDSIDSEHIYIYIYISNEMYILITPDQTVQLGSGDPLGGSILDPPHPALLRVAHLLGVEQPLRLGGARRRRRRRRRR